MDFATGLTTLNTRLQDSDNFTFTVAEKTDALTESWNDDYVVSEVFDTTSITFSTSVQEYDVESIVDGMTGLYYDPDGDGYEALPAEAYEMITETTFHIDRRFMGLVDGKVLAIKGYKKLTTSDSVSDKLKDYVVKLAQLNCIDVLMQKRLLRFVKNDTTMADILNGRTVIEKEVEKYRQKFRRQYQRT